MNTSSIAIRLKKNQLSLNSIREESLLSLRKKSIHSFLFQKKFETNSASIKDNILEISIVKLQLPDKLKYHFRLKKENLDSNLPKTIEYLQSNDYEYVKLASFALNRYFKEIAAETKIDPFISFSILDHIANLLKSELVNVLVNLTLFDCSSNYSKVYAPFDYYLRLTAQDYLEIYKKCLLEYNDKGEIAEMVLLVLLNVIFEKDECFTEILKTDLPKIVLELVLSPNTLFAAFKEGAKFLSLVAKNSSFCSNNEQEIELFHFFNSLITEAFLSEIISFGLIGLKNLSTTNRSFLHLYLSMGTIKKIMLLDLEKKDEFQYTIVSNYLDIIINLSEHLSFSQVKKMLKEYSILNFIEANLLTVSKHNLKLKCITFILNISSKGIEEVNILIYHNIFKRIISLLGDNDFVVRKYCVLIIKNCLSLNDYEIAVVINKFKAIEIIINHLLIVETDEELLLNCIDLLIAFLFCGHNIASSNPLREVLLSYNIEGFMSSISINSDAIEHTIKKLQLELSP